jgi:spermidine/putrescine transport system ATP-binding protein/putrescine transport system ATP-binding protein
MVDHIIRIEDVTKQFAGGAKAVDCVSFSIERGEFFSLLGPSGCGKTTLLRMIAGFEFPTEGEIFIDNQPSSLIPSYRRPTNMVFQSYAIFPHLNVYDNIAYGLRKERISGSEKRRRVNEALAMIKLEGFGSRRGDQLSGGQRQRVALARALVKRPKVLLLDEPLGALDKKLREEMQIELRQLQKSVGITFVFVTHDQEEALSMSDRIAVMGKGKVLQIAPPRELYEQPQNVEVATFIGTINLVDATVKAVSGGEASLEAAALGQIKAPAIQDIKAGDKVVVAVRPENLNISATKPSSATFVEGSIKASAYLGDRSHYQVHIKGRAVPLYVAAQNADHAESIDISKPVYVSWNPASLIVLKS